MPKRRAVAEQQAKYSPGRLRLVGGQHLLAIDPGDKHVGVAAFVEESDGTPVCAWATEYTPDEAANLVAGMLFRGELRYLVVERFALYADKAMAQVGSEMQTSELIGVFKYLVRVHNESATGDGGARDPWLQPPCDLFIQGADIKKGIRAQIEARGISRITPKETHHGDAEEHGWYRILRGVDDGVRRE